MHFKLKMIRVWQNKLAKKIELTLRAPTTNIIAPLTLPTCTAKIWFNWST